jgi:hypothetical protein
MYCDQKTAYTSMLHYPFARVPNELQFLSAVICRVLDLYSRKINPKDASFDWIG